MIEVILVAKNMCLGGGEQVDVSQSVPLAVSTIDRGDLKLCNWHASG
jgi:hypothetical protein